ncbi:MAG: flippase [Candidatus Omnitrophica bacterium]|nr:flippase [Candidatus Omnitrophota bacterium]
MSHSQTHFFKLLNNSSAVLGGEVFSRFVSFFSGILVARALGGENYGQFSFIYVYLSFFEVFVQFGVNPILVRKLAQGGETGPALLGNAILMRVALVVLALPVAFWGVHALGYPLSVKQGVLFAYFQLFLTVRPVYEAVFKAHLQMIYPAMWSGIRALVNLAFVAGVAFWRPGVIWFIAAYMASGAAALAGLAWQSRRLTRVDFRFDREVMISLARESAPLVLSAYLTILYYRVNVFMLSFMKGFLDVGYYSAATRVTEALMAVSGALLASYYPLLSKAFHQDRLLFEHHVRGGIRVFLLTGLPVAIGGSIAGRELIELFFGAEFAPAGLALSILCWHVCFAYVAGLLANLLISCGRQMTDMWISFFLAAANIGMNALLIPRFSFNGAALATVVTEVIGLVLYMVYAARSPLIRLPVPWKDAFLALKLNLVFAVLVFAASKILAGRVLILVALSSVLYGVLLWAWKIVSAADLKNYFTYTFSKGAGLEP